jgi:hypothetical protein
MYIKIKLCDNLGFARFTHFHFWQILCIKKFVPQGYFVPTLSHTLSQLLSELYGDKLSILYIYLLSIGTKGQSIYIYQKEKENFKMFFVFCKIFTFYIFICVKSESNFFRGGTLSHSPIF